MSNSFLTPVGRLVMGSVLVGQDKDFQGRPKTDKNGNPKTEWFLGLAIPKTDPKWPELHEQIKAEARTGFPTMFDASGGCSHPSFAWKIIDGDSTTPNSNGKVPSQREGFAGHWVMCFEGGFAPRAYTAGGESAIVDPDAIKLGSYIRVYGSAKANGEPTRPGVYLNMAMVEFIGHGPEIVTGPDARSVFGAVPAALPAGASATPVAPATPIAQPVTPVPSFLKPPAAPVAPPPPPAAKTYDVQGATYTREQLVSFGWTEDQIDSLG